ncbi:DNA polymerase III subunit beta [Legionella israelensis]|uniref:Beta sliding clamp n=1 Tax=Legionella israelensis TaxID=454 RepID=A0AAX1ED45_9GAMM|nr:DNA polymerase III subunit beta [Legionella israelensis]QBR83003.1 DNA polymerase III subunit beta [Legionella israelensis]
MFELSIKKADLLAPLLTVAGAVDKKQSLTILTHFLLKLKDKQLFITATDLEIEICAAVCCESTQTSATITVPAKKFIDIIRSLDEHATPILSLHNDILTIKEGRSSFRLTTLPADNYPASENECNDIELSLPRQNMLQLLQSTHFAMSQQDVRIFLNGLLLEFEAKMISAVATDGHRMAINRYICENNSYQRFLLPRKGVQELLRLLHSIPDESISISAGKSHFSVETEQFTFVTKLIDARFPPYNKAIPKNNDKCIVLDCVSFKKALSRIVILAHEKSKAVMLHLQPSLLTLIANNQEQEEAVESLEAFTEGDEIKIGFNASYVLDVLNHFGEGQIRLSMLSTESSILIESVDNEHYQYILMPMKI